MFKEDYINIPLMVFFIYVAMFCLVILNFALWQFNYCAGVSFCALLNIPHDLTLTSISPNFLYSFCIILYTTEITILVKLYEIIRNILYKYF